MLNTDNIQKALKKALRTTSNQNILFRYTEKINIKSLCHNFPSKEMAYISYPNQTPYLSFGKCIEYSLNSKKELLDLKKLSFSFQPFGNNSDEQLKIFGGVSFDMDSKARDPWKGIPKGLFFIPEFLITEKIILSCIYWNHWQRKEGGCFIKRD